MATNSRTLEFTLLSAEGLHIRGKPADKNVFAVVRADSIASHTTATATATGSNGSLSWKETFSVEVGAHARCMTIEVKCRTGAGERDVGVARIALSDFLGGSVPEHKLQFLCYRLRDWDGRENGIVNFSVRVVAPPPHDGGAEDDCAPSLGGVVTGIPVWRNESSTSSMSNV
ncbi:unnamed protein product [Sphenostylis stenocarpa]|uniref:C2 domain-containing protein n=1 Tax=Sphenostylis stenocarpa TaxID=92480 RepID=A0AA86SAS3_9FABA|nr:unnamed protein product [Sphenostylis stenocarpa]